MIKKLTIILFVFILLLCCFSISQAADLERNNWLLGVIFKLENMRDKSIEDIQKYDREIQKCDNTIIKSDNIVRLAQQKGNIKAEEIAREASIKAQEARIKNRKIKKSAELNKKRTEVALAYVNNVFSDALSYPQDIKSVITNYSGRVSIQKKNGEHFTFEKNQKGFLETGDEVSTYENSSVELQFLDGRGTMNVGQHSQVKMEEDDTGTQVMNMIQGKVNISVEKLENYQRMMEEKIKTYEVDLKIVKDEAKEKMVDEYESIKKEMGKFAKKLEVRTINAIMSIRGTQFLVYEDDIKGTEIVVLDGGVELKSKNENRIVAVNEGYRATVAKDGKLSEPEKIDMSNLERWWEEQK